MTEYDELAAVSRDYRRGRLDAYDVHGTQCVEEWWLMYAPVTQTQGSFACQQRYRHTNDS